MSASILLSNAAAATAPPDALKVGGVTPFTATDYPGKLAAVIFVQGCPWRCGYCHNPHLQPREAANLVSWERLQTFLERRAGLVDAIVFSGGEPTLDPALPAAIAAVRARGFQVGLHTACIYPRRLREVLPLVDWVGFDVKTDFARYAEVTGHDAGAAALECVQAIIASGVAHECRTTIHPHYHNAADLEALAERLAGLGVRNYALQVFRNQGCTDPNLGRVAASFPGTQSLQRIARHFEQFCLRDH